MSDCSPLGNVFANNDIVWASNSTVCTGPVYDVKVTVELWRESIGEWKKVASDTEQWGEVRVSRSGEAQAGVSDDLTPACLPYFARAYTTWTDPDGTPREADHNSPTVITWAGKWCGS